MTSASCTFTADTEHGIIFGSRGEGLKVVSVDTSQERTVGNGTTKVDAVAYDAVSRKVYYSAYAAIHRINFDGSGHEVLYNSSTYDSMWGIGLDWIAGNLFGVSRSDGYVFVCKPRDAASGSWMCKTLLSGQGYLQGTAVNPNAGDCCSSYWTIYWTKGSSIMKASMDGTNAVEIVSESSSSGISDPMGIAIDHWSLKLFWVDYDTNKMQSSTLDGHDIQTIAQLPGGTHLWAIAVDDTLIYFSHFNGGSAKLRSCAKTGGDMRILCNASAPILQPGVVASVPTPTTSSNDCAGQSCSGICVLMPSSFRCLRV